MEIDNYYTWNQLKKIILEKDAKAIVRYKIIDKRYEVSFEYDGYPRMVAIFNSTSRDGIDFETNFKPYIVETHKLDKDGNTPVSMQPPSGTAVNFYSHNLCDKCSWHTESIYVASESLTSIDGKTWSSLNSHWIDLTHGRVYKEDQVLLDRDPTLPSLVPSIEVMESGVWVTKSENSWGFLDNDFTIDYDLGTVTFNVAIGSGAQVRASYHHADAMVFYITPDPGTVLKIIYAEIQHTNPLKFNQTISFQTQIYNPANPPSRINYGTPTLYKSMRDFEQEARGSYATKEPRGGLWTLTEVVGLQNVQNSLNSGSIEISTRFDGTNWISLMKKMSGDRGFNSPQSVIPLPYNAYKPIDSAFGTRIKITMDSPTNEALLGEFANVTFYCIKE